MVKLRRPGLKLLQLIALTPLLAVAAIACADPGFEAGPLGAVEFPPGEPVHIRALGSLTGASDLGIEPYAGVVQAAQDYGPIHGREVVVGAAIDTRCSDDGGAAGAMTVAGDPRIVGVIGTSCSLAASAAAPIISEAGMVMIAPSTTSPSLTSDLQGNPGSNHHAGYYRTANNDIYQARAVARFVYNDLGLRRMGAINDGDPYTSGLTGAFSDAFQSLGGTVTIESVSRGDTDMVPILTRIAADGPEGLFFPLFRGEATHIVQQLDQVDGLDGIPLIGGAALLSPLYLTEPETEGMYFPGPELGFSENVNQATGRSGAGLEDAFAEKYGQPPTSVYLPHAYDAATMLLRAVEAVAVVEGETLYVDREQLRQALTDTKGFGGIIGQINCDDFGDCGTGRLLILHHTDADSPDPETMPVVYQFAP